MTVYRDFDQAGLDAQYDNYAAIPDWRDHVAAWRERSRETLRDHPVARDLGYGADPGQTLDVYFARASDAPVHVFFHGGFWYSQDKANFAFVAWPLIEAGAAVVIPNYDLCPAVTIDDIVRQCREAIVWIHRHARIFGGDPEAITLSGHSAGGQLLARALETDWSAYGVPDSVVKGGVALSGLYDLEPLRRSYLDVHLRLTDDQVLRNSPVLHVPRRRIPLVLGVGADETDEFRRQTREYADALARRGYAAELIEVAGVHHFSILDRAYSAADPFGLLAMAAG